MRAPIAVFIGLVLGIIPAALIRAAIRVQAEFAARPAGVSLVPVVVTKSAMRTGQVVTMDDVTIRSVPETLVTASLVKPDSASYIVNQPLAVPLAPGEPFRWAAIETVATIEGQRPPEELLAACGDEMKRRAWPAVPETLAALKASFPEAQR